VFLKGREELNTPVLEDRGSGGNSHRTPLGDDTR
jgi:hypothetical protein